MDLLSLVSLVTKRRGDYFSQAKTLARKYKTQEDLENQMLKEAKAVVLALRDKQIKWEEYERSVVDKTLISALAAVYLGAKDSQPGSKMEKAWPMIVGDMLPPLIRFLGETKARLDDGVLRIGDSTMDFVDFIPDDILDDPDYDTDSPAMQAAISSGVGRSWPALFGRLVRYLATPTYSFFNLGEYFVRQEQGFSEMRRVAKKDKRTCPDCKGFNAAGWQPIGSLPMPGRDCRCYDRCRCHIDYR
jgi:hypothetical protein